MAEVLRLLRLSLVLRLAIAVVAAVAYSGAIGNISPLAPLTALGSLVLVFVISIALARGKDDARTVNRLLAATIIVQAFESAFVGLVFRNGPRPGPREAEPATPPNDVVITSTLLLRNTFGGALFAAIPAMLGSWVGGRRSVFGWTALTVLTNFLADAFALAPNWMALRFVVGPTLSQMVVVGILAYFVGSLADKMREEQNQLAHANRQLQEQAHVREQLASSRERVRLSRDLHDTLAHTLAGLIVQLKAIGTLLDKQPDAARRELRKAEEAAKIGLDETRAAISDLRANVVRDLGLSGALQRQVELVGESSGIQATFERGGDEPVLSDEEAEGLFRIAQEALYNVQRHANAARVRVRLDAEPGEARMVTLSIDDDGEGFDISALDDSRFGLRGMRERAELIGAHLRVDSAPGKGTRVMASLNGRS
jgi:signal transduction histidine kinase